MARVTDNFNRANGALGNADTGQAWTNSAGSHVISSNKAVRSTGNPAISTLDPAITDYDIQADITVNASADVTSEGVVFHFFNATNYLHAAVGDLAGFDRGVAIGKVSGGVGSTLASSATGLFSTGQTVRLKVLTTLGFIQCFLDGIAVVSFTLSGADQTTFGSLTKAGIVTFSNTASTFDNFFIDNANPQGFWF